MIVIEQTPENTKYKQQLQKAHFHLKFLFPSPFQSTSQNKERPCTQKRITMRPGFSDQSFTRH